MNSADSQAAGESTRCMRATFNGIQLISPAIVSIVRYGSPSVGPTGEPTWEVLPPSSWVLWGASGSDQHGGRDLDA
jgi:hypothetical protein